MTYATARATRGRRPRAHRARSRLIVLLVIVILLVAADFAARAVAESVMASKVEQQAKLTSKPDVTIDGFPFLTQVASKSFQRVTINTSNLATRQVTITSIDAVAQSIRLNSYAFSSGTIGSVTGTAFISFAALSAAITQQAGPLGQLIGGNDLKLSAAGPNEVKASVNLLVGTGSATWRVSRLTGHSLQVHLVSSSGIPSEALGSLQNLTIQLPALPLGLSVDNVAVKKQGLVGDVSGHDVPFGS